MAQTRESDVYNVFKDYFGEEKVDLVDNNIIVYWDEVTVTNEIGESTVIKDLYAKVNPHDGTFQLARCTFTADQALSHYTHSHISSGTVLGSWGFPCLGRGPIIRTIGYLQAHDDDLERWQLYCWELDKYVHVESLNGVPYIKLRTIGTDARRWEPFNYNVHEDYNKSTHALPAMLRPFVELLLKDNVIQLTVTESYFTLGMSIKDLVLKVSRYFIEWFNNTRPCTVEELKAKRIIEPIKIKDDKLYTYRSDRDRDYSLRARDGLYSDIFFKGEHKKIHIGRITTDLYEGAIWCLAIDYIFYIADVIIKTLNYTKFYELKEDVKIL